MTGTRFLPSSASVPGRRIGGCCQGGSAAKGNREDEDSRSPHNNSGLRKLPVAKSNELFIMLEFA